MRAHTTFPCRLRGAGRIAATTLGLVLALAPPAAARQIEGVEFSPTAVVRDQTLRLHGVGLLRYRLFFKVYVAGLYLGPEISPRQVLDDTPKRLEIHYFYSISQDDLRSSTREAIRSNVGDEVFETLEPSVAAFNALYQGVDPGDRYALNYLPGVGVELVLNGDSLGTVPGAEFARAVFSIWFGPEEIDASLKESLLEG